MVTRCPQCKTSFRITPAQLKTARGAVRCGSCLTIFKASENLISDSRISTPQVPTEKNSGATTDIETTSAPPKAEEHNAPQATPNTAATDSSEADISDDELISDDMGDDQHGFSSDFGDDIDPSMLGATHRPSSSLFDRKPKAVKDEPLDHSDESWAVSLLEEDDEEELSPSESITTDEPDDDDRLAAFDAIDNDEYDIQETAEPEIEKQERSSSVGSFTLIADDESDAFEEASVESAPAPAPTKSNKEQDLDTPIQAFDPERAALLNSIEADPVEMAFRVEPRTWPKKLLWAGLSLTALFALYIQWNIANFNDLARQQPYRSWYSTLCPLLSCQLPSLSAPEKISSYNLVVRSHPNIEQALIVDTIILNKAPFEQPFPKLIITFSDRDHNAIARRQFTPAEYLRGELAGRKSMPSGQPIHIALELSDPGTHAVNYSADIAP